MSFGTLFIFGLKRQFFNIAQDFLILPRVVIAFCFLFTLPILFWLYIYLLLPKFSCKMCHNVASFYLYVLFKTIHLQFVAILSFITLSGAIIVIIIIIAVITITITLIQMLANSYKKARLLLTSLLRRQRL